MEYLRRKWRSYWKVSEFSSTPHPYIKIFQPVFPRFFSMNDREKEQLEKGYRMARSSVKNMLKDGEVLDGELRKKVSEVMTESLSGFDTDEYKYDMNGLADRTFELVMSEIPTEKHRGIEESYVSLKDERLSEEVAEDVAWREKYLRRADSYMYRTGDGMTEDEFSKTVLDYLRDETTLPQRVEDKDFLMTAYGIIHSLQEKYVLDTEKRYFGIPESEIEQVYRKL